MPEWKFLVSMGPVQISQFLESHIHGRTYWGSAFGFPFICTVCSPSSQPPESLQHVHQLLLIMKTFGASRRGDLGSGCALTRAQWWP